MVGPVMRVWVYLCLVASGACLRSPPDTNGDPPAQVPSALTTYDEGGAPWPLSGIPRAPVFSLTFREPPSNAAQRLWLLRGTAHPDVIEDLTDPPLRTDTTRSVVPLAVEVSGSEVDARPQSALEPGARYALVWTLGEKPAHVVAMQVSTSSAAGARLVESWPGERDVRVPPNASLLLLCFDGYVGGVDATTIALREQNGTAVAVAPVPVSARSLGLDWADCVRAELIEGLKPSTRYVLRVGPGLRDATGAVLPERLLQFATRATEDADAPRFRKTSCAQDEVVTGPTCLLSGEREVTVRGAVDEPVLIALSAGERTVSTLALSDTFELTLAGLVPGTRYEAVLVARDIADHASTEALVFDTASGMAKLTIDEVRADPLGPEPAQEYVELLNFGNEPVQIMGFSLTDDAFESGHSVVAALGVDPGERVLLVGPEFDTQEPSDGELPAGVRVARISGSLSLRNDGEALFLRDALGKRLSAAPRLSPESPGQCVARANTDARSGALHAFAPDPAGGCTPGAATEWP